MTIRSARTPVCGRKLAVDVRSLSACVRLLTAIRHTTKESSLMRRNSHAVFATITASTLLFGGFATATAQAAPAKAESLYAPSALVLTVARGEDPLTAT